MMPDPTPSQSVYCYDTGRWEWIDATTGYSWDRSGFVPGQATTLLRTTIMVPEIAMEQPISCDRMITEASSVPLRMACLGFCCRNI